MIPSMDTNQDTGTPSTNEHATKGTYSRILIVMPNWVGDVVMATPALQALRDRFPSAYFAVLLKSYLAEILHGGDWIHETIHWPAGKGKSRPKRRQGFLGLAAELRDRKFDLAVLLSNSFRSALLTRLAGIPRRVGYDRDGRGLLLTDRLLPTRVQGKYVPVPMVTYYNAIAKYLGCRKCQEEMKLFTTEEEETLAAQRIEQAGIKPEQPIVVLNPGASFGRAKCWLSERFAEVADRLVDEYNAAIFISTGPRELDSAREVAQHMKQPVTVLDNPVLKLGPTKALIRRASLLITNDTGPRHFGKALGTPVITIFGPTEPKWSQNSCTYERILMVKVHCGPCMKRECPLDHRCMTRITTEMVIEQARNLMTEKISSKSS